MNIDEIEAIVRGADNATLAKWWCELNRWEWPTELGEPEPQGTQNPKRSKIMNDIVDRVGIKECLREWNRERLPGEALDEWWENRERVLQ